MTIAQLRRMFKAVLLCMPINAINPFICADATTCCLLFQRTCLFLGGVVLVTLCATSTVGGSGTSESFRDCGNKDLQQSSLGASREYGNITGINDGPVQDTDRWRTHETKWKKKMDRRLEVEISKWRKRERNKKKKQGCAKLRSTFFQSSVY
eukprot:jgi/Antlo1/557/455